MYLLLSSIRMENTKKKPHFRKHTFIKNYNRVASTNGWSDKKEIKCLPLYLEGPIITFFHNNESNLSNDTKFD